jgi:glycosyltransferase involved in cell wall biosynthesis
MSVELAAVVLTRNEERHIGECLDSLSWADEQVIIDDFSEDRTAEIARGRGARMIQHALEDFGAQRDVGLREVNAAWILYVDADERATPAVEEEVRRVIRYTGDQARPGWWIPRQNYMLGHWMRGGGWSPDYQLRLLKRGKARYDPAHPVHELVILDGDAGYLEQPLIHYNYDTVSQFREKMLRYTDFEAQILREKGVRVRPWTYLSMPLREFWRRFVVLGGYRDHVYGLLFSGLMAWYTFVTYQRLRRLRAGERAGAGSLR